MLLDINLVDNLRNGTVTVIPVTVRGLLCFSLGIKSHAI